MEMPLTRNTAVSSSVDSVSGLWKTAQGNVGEACKLVQHASEQVPTYVRETMEEAALSFSFMNSK